MVNHNRYKVVLPPPSLFFREGWGEAAKFSFLLFLTLCFSMGLWAQAGMVAHIDLLIKETLPENSEVGISIYDLTARKSLYVYRDKKLSRPASTMKLLTAITALARPEADEPFRTEVWYKGVIEHDTLQGDLYIIGGFDPEFDDRGMDVLVADIVALPFSVVNGKIYGDVSMKDSLYWGSGWAWDDSPASYQPYLSPLMFHKGMVEVIAFPSATKGGTARLRCVPESSYYTLRNTTKTQTPSAGKFSISRNWLENKNDIIVQGNVENSKSGEVNVYSSQDFFMHSLLDRLMAKGINIPGGYAFSVFQPDAASVRISRWDSPIQEVLNQLMKESDNLNAEAMLYRLGAQATGKKRIIADDGIAEIKSLIRQLGHDPANYKIADGCGLSNYNYLSPALLVDFLIFAYSRTDIFQKLYKALPIGGVDGTLKYRMKKGKAYKKVHAKTGSYTAINALAGYLKAANGHEIAFAILNQNVLSAAKARDFQDKVCEVLCE